MLRHPSSDASFSLGGKSAWDQDHIQDCTWITRPAAANNAGVLIHVSDIGVGGSLWLSDGTRWSPLNGSVTLGQSGIAASCPADTAVHDLAIAVVPGGTLGLNGRLEVTSLWTVSTGGGNKNLRVMFGGSSFHGSNQGASPSLFLFTAIHARGAAAQVSPPTVSGYGPDSAGVLLGSVDTTVDQSLVLSGQKSIAGDVLTLQAYSFVLRTP